MNPACATKDMLHTLRFSPAVNDNKKAESGGSAFFVRQGFLDQRAGLGAGFVGMPPP
jgi:hypothetical protein